MVINFVHTYIICFHIFLYLTLLLSIKIVLKLEKSGFFYYKNPTHSDAFSRVQNYVKYR